MWLCDFGRGLFPTFKSKTHTNFYFLRLYNCCMGPTVCYASLLLRLEVLFDNVQVHNEAEKRRDKTQRKIAIFLSKSKGDLSDLRQWFLCSILTKWIRGASLRNVTKIFLSEMWLVHWKMEVTSPVESKVRTKVLDPFTQDDGRDNCRSDIPKVFDRIFYDHG